jgi:hypothetical protein
VQNQRSPFNSSISVSTFGLLLALTQLSAGCWRKVAGTLEEALSMPGWFDTVVVSGLLIGFPVAMIPAWAFDLTPEA